MLILPFLNKMIDNLVPAVAQGLFETGNGMRGEDLSVEMIGVKGALCWRRGGCCDEDK